MASIPSEEMEAKMAANLKEKTGKSLEQWIKLAKASKLAKHGEIVNHLKKEHGLTHGYANFVAHRLNKSAAADQAPEDLVTAQYSGAKAELKPVYDAIIKAIGAFGKDVELAPKKGYVSLRRKTQFAIVQPTTATRVDVGIKLKATDSTVRLEEAGSFNGMVTHRVRVTNSKEVDKELIGWLKQAYTEAG